MKSRRQRATTPTPDRQQNATARAPRPRRGRPYGDKAHRRAQQKRGAYKRVEVFLGVEAAIALRRLMRDGRSAREVIEALLRAESLRSGESEPSSAGFPR